MAPTHAFPWNMLMHGVTYAICMLDIHVLSSQASVDFQHTQTGVSIVRRAVLPSTVHGYDLRPPEHYCAADAAACTWYLHTCQDVWRSPPVLAASGPVHCRRFTSYVGSNRSFVGNDTIRSVRHLSYVKRSCAHNEHSTPQRSRVQPPKPPGHNTCFAISVHNALARTHSWRTPPTVSPKGSTLALSNIRQANLVAGCRILQSCADLSRCDSKPCLNLHSCQHTCQADWRVPPASSTTGLTLTFQEDQTNAGRYSLLNRSGVCGPAGHSIGSMRYLSRRSNKHICQADRRAPPAAHQPGARPTLHFLLIMREMHLPETTWQAWRQKEIEDHAVADQPLLLAGIRAARWRSLEQAKPFHLTPREIALTCYYWQLRAAEHSKRSASSLKAHARSRIEYLTKQEQWQRAMALLDPPHAHDARLALQIARKHATQVCVCLPSGVSFDYWMTNVLRDASGVRWNERWPYTPDPYRIMDCPQSMLWIGSTVSVDIASAPQQSDDSSDSSAGDYRLLTSANCYGACTQTLRSAQLCVDTYLCINCQNTAPHHPHTARLVRLCQKIWTPDKAESFGIDVAENQPTNTAKIHRIYTLSMPEIMQASDDLRFTASIGVVSSHVNLRIVQIHSQILLRLATKIGQSLLSSAHSAVIDAKSRASMKSHNWPWLTSLLSHRLAAVGDSGRGWQSRTKMIIMRLTATRWRCHSPSRMPGAESEDVCLFVAALSQALELQQNCVRARKVKPSHNGGAHLLPKQIEDSDCKQVKTLVFQGFQLTNIRAGHCTHPGMPGVTMRSSGSSEAKARVPKQRRSPPSETGNSVCLGILRYANNLKSPNVIRHQGGAQGRASESITRGAAKDAQRHAHAFLFLAHHGLSKHPHTVPCRSVHSNFSHLHHNAAYPAEIAWQYSYSRLGIRKEREDYQLALTEPALKRKCIPQNLSCLQRPDQTHWQQTQTPDSTGSWCNAFPDITVPVTCLASCDMQPFSLSDNTWARVFPMDPDPKSRQRRRPPSRFRKGHVPLRLWTPKILREASAWNKSVSTLSR